MTRVFAFTKSQFYQKKSIKMSVITRSLVNIISPRLQKEGGGFLIRRPVGVNSEIGNLFLLVDHLDYSIKPGAGFPGSMHPHRGFETVSYQLQGSMDKIIFSDNSFEIIVNVVRFFAPHMYVRCRWHYVSRRCAVDDCWSGSGARGRRGG